MNLNTKTILQQHSFNLLLVSISAFLVYSNSLHGIWAMDDVLINSGAAIEKIFNITKSRLISFLTFIINQKINPYDQFNFRVFNLLIHMLNSFLVYFVSFITISNSKTAQKDSRLYLYVPLISALLFAIHPLNINAVAYIVQRMASLSTFFTLIALSLYIIAARDTISRNKVVLYFATALCVLLAILSKETGLMAAPLILLYDYVFISRFDIKVFSKKAFIVMITSVGIVILASFFTPVFGDAKSIISILCDFNKPMEHKAWMSTDVYWSPLQHVLTEFRVVSRYLVLFIFPLPKLLVFDWWGYPVSKGLFEPATTFISMLFIISAVLFSLLKIKKYPFLSFGILWYFIAISLESFIGIGLDLYFEHRNYLPLTGLCFGITAHILSFPCKWLQSKYAKTMFFIFIILFFGGMTFQRNFVWSDPIVFWKDITEKTPENPRAFNALANLYFSHSIFRDAENCYKVSLKIAKDKKSYAFLNSSLYRLGFMYIMLERQADAKKIIDIIEKIYGHSLEYNALQGMYLHSTRDYNSAIEFYNDALSYNFSMYNIADKSAILTLKGESYRAVGEYEKALECYREALDLSATLPAAHHGIAKLDIMNQKFDSAAGHLKTALFFDPYNFMVLSDMAYLLLLQGKKPEEAMTYAKKAVGSNPPLPQPYLIMGVIQLASGNEQEAQKALIKAQERKAPAHQILFNMSWGYSISGNTEKQAYCLRELLKLKDAPDNIRNTANRLLSQSTGK